MTVWKSPPRALHSLSMTASMSEQGSWWRGLFCRRLPHQAGTARADGKINTKQKHRGAEREHGSSTANGTLYSRLPWRKWSHVSLGRLISKSLYSLFSMEIGNKTGNMAQNNNNNKQTTPGVGQALHLLVTLRGYVAGVPHTSCSATPSAREWVTGTEVTPSPSPSRLTFLYRFFQI